MEEKIHIKNSKITHLTSIQKTRKEIRVLKKAIRLKRNLAITAPGLDKFTSMTVDELNSQILNKKAILLNLKKQQRAANRKDYATESERINKLRNTYLNAGYNFGAFDQDERDDK